MGHGSLIGWGARAILLVALAQAPAADPLTRAREAYNNRQYEAAIGAAQEALKIPASANAAAVVLARAYLERYPTTLEPADLEGARAALAQVRPVTLTASDRSEFYVGLGLAAFRDGCKDGCFSAAAEFFDLALASNPAADPATRESIFEWWATSLDHQAQHGLEEDRGQIYRRLLERVEVERVRAPDSASCAYWMVAATGGVGDFSRAWGAAIVGWTRAKHMGPRGETLRSNLHGLMYEILLPERAKLLVPDGDPRPTLEQLRRQWADIEERYK